MTWTELIRDEINKLETKKESTKKKLDQIREDDSPRHFAKKIELAADIKSIQETITVLYILLGKAGEVGGD